MSKHRYMVVEFHSDGSVHETKFYKIEYACEHFREAIGNDKVLDMQLCNIEHPTDDVTLREYARHD